MKIQNYKFKNNINIMRKNLVLLGMMGVGKTTLGKILAKNYKLAFIDTDSQIEKKIMMPINEIFEKKGEKFFRNEEEKISLASLNKKNCVISLGGGAFINEKVRKKVLDLGISIWLDIDIKKLNERLKKTSRRPLLKNNNIKKKLDELYFKRKKIYNLANFKINCDNLNIYQVGNKIIKLYEKI